MTLAIDSSALIQRFVPGASRSTVLAAMEAETTWCASELARTEVLLALHRLAGDPNTDKELSSRLRRDWGSFLVVPVDEICLARAVEIGSEFRLTTIDAIHLAAADRLPRPLTYATLDPNQIPAAAALGFDVLSPVSA